MKRYALYVLVIGNLVGLGLLACLWVDSDGELKNIKWTPPAAQKTSFADAIPVLPKLAAADVGQFVLMLSRPVFSQSRRPPPPPPPPAPPPPVDHLSTAVLTGLFDSGTKGAATLVVSGTNRRVRMNEAVEGWTLKNIQGRSATFQRGNETRTLQLQRAKNMTYSGLSPSTPANSLPAGGGLPQRPPQAIQSPTPMPVAPTPAQPGKKEPEAQFGPA